MMHTFEGLLTLSNPCTVSLSAAEPRNRIPNHQIGILPNECRNSRHKGPKCGPIILANHTPTLRQEVSIQDDTLVDVGNRFFDQVGFRAWGLVNKAKFLV